jgi:hypothetical protein
MVSPPIQVFLTTIASQAALRQRQGVFNTLPPACNTNSLITSSIEYILRILQAKNITFSSYDLASDEDAKRLWRRKAPLGERCTQACARHLNELTCTRQATVAWNTNRRDVSRGRPIKLLLLASP